MFVRFLIYGVFSSINCFVAEIPQVSKPTQHNVFNSDIVRAIRQRNYFLKSKDIINYKLWRQKVKFLMFYAKTNYYNQ